MIFSVTIISAKRLQSEGTTEGTIRMVMRLQLDKSTAKCVCECYVINRCAFLMGVMKWKTLHADLDSKMRLWMLCDK